MHSSNGRHGFHLLKPGERKCVCVALTRSTAERWLDIAEAPGGRPASLAMRYGFAVLAVALAAMLRCALEWTVGDLRATYITFYPAVMLAAIVAGGRAGLLATVLSALIADLWILAPGTLFTVHGSSDWVGHLFFLCMGGFLSLVADQYRQARRRAAAYESELALQIERRRAEREHARDKEFMAVTLASIGDGVIVTDMEGQVTFLNGEAEWLTGWSTQEAGGQPLTALFRVLHEATRQPVENPFDRVLRLGTIVGMDDNAILVSRGGRDIPIDSSGAPIRSPEGTVAGVVIVFRDCSQRRISERAVRESQAFLQNTLDALPMHLCVVDRGGKILMVNEAWRRFARLNGASPGGDFAGSNYLRVCEAVEGEEIDDALAMAGGLRDVLEGRRDLFEIEYPCHGDGVARWFIARVTPLETPAGRLAVVVHWNITQRKEMETALQCGQNDLRRRADELARSNAELEQFAYVASHDLKEPLRMVSSYTRLLAEEYGEHLGEEARRYIHYAADGAIRMQRLIDDLLTYSRVGKLEEACTNVDLDEVVDEALANLESAVREGDVRIDRLPLGSVYGNRRTLVQLMQNLVANAVKFRQSVQPCVSISAIDHDHAREIIVTDNGIGIDPEFHERIFRLFQRLHTRQEYAGTGIGLAVCKKIVDQHGGRIWVESEVGQGSKFHVVFPSRAFPEPKTRMVHRDGLCTNR
ncbi:MAG: ATP-binding protein [Planctomycetota bacterium]